MDADANFGAELRVDNDSNDKVFEGFSLEEAAESERRKIFKDEETAGVIHALENRAGLDSDEDDAASDPRDSAYNCQRLKEFAPATGTTGHQDIANNVSESDIFLHFLDDAVIHLLVEETIL